MAELTPKVITELPELTSIPDTAAFPVSSGGASHRTLWSTIKNDISGTNSERLTNDYLDITALRNNAGSKFLRVSGYPNQALSANTSYTLGTLTSPYRPTLQISVYLQVRGGANALLTITTDGIVSFTPYADIAANQGINIHYAYL